MRKLKQDIEQILKLSRDLSPPIAKARHRGSHWRDVVWPGHASGRWSTSSQPSMTSCCGTSTPARKSTASTPRSPRVPSPLGAGDAGALQTVFLDWLVRSVGGGAGSGALGEALQALTRGARLGSGAGVLPTLQWPFGEAEVLAARPSDAVEPMMLWGDDVDEPSALADSWHL